MAYESFDDFDSTESLDGEYAEQKPYALREDKSDEGTLDWLNTNFDKLEQKAQSRMNSYARWAALYKGIHWRSQEVSDADYDTQADTKKPKIVDNYILQFIDSRVSQMARFGSNFSAIPWNNEISDTNTAKACEKLLKGRADMIDLDKTHRDADRIKYKYGTVFLSVEWDKEQGQVSKEYEELEQVYPKGIPKDILKKLGDASRNIGDVDVLAIAPYKVYPQSGMKTWKKVQHVDITDWRIIEELKHDYPKVADKLEGNKRNFYDFETYEISIPEGQMQVREFYYPPNKYLPKGEYIKYCDDAILERTEYPHKHGELPFVIDKDMEIEDELFGRPAISQIEQMQRHTNNISSAQARDLGAGSAPKWVAAKGSVDFRSFDNEFSIMEFKGPLAPQLTQNNPVSEQSFKMQDRIQDRMGKLMKVYSITQGDVPTGVTANSALRFLDEQESQILADDERKRKKRVLRTYRMMVNVMAQYYSTEDDRTLRVLGKNNAYQIESMKSADFTKIYDVQFQNTSSLPDTKTGKIAAIIDLNMATQTDPIFRREDIVDMLDLGTDETFTEEATYSLDSARQMMDLMLKGKEAPQPELHFDLLVYYTTMFRAIQSFQFISTVPEELKAKVYQYIETLEGLIFIKMQRNPKLANEVSFLSYYPSFFQLPPLPMMDPPAPGNPEMTPTAQQQQGTADPSQAKNAQNKAKTAQEAEAANLK